MLVSSSDAFPKNETLRTLYDCAVNILRERNLLDKKFTYTPEIIPIEVDCIDLSASFKTRQFLVLSDALLEEDAEFTKTVECIIGKTQRLNTGLTFLRKFVYENDHTLPVLKRQTLIREAWSEIEEKVEVGQEYCAPDKMFGEWFDNWVYDDETGNSAEEDIGDLREDYCHRKFLVEQKFIDDNVYKNISINPNNIETNFSCDKYWNDALIEYRNTLRDSFSSAFDNPSRKITRCIGDTIESKHYPELVLKLWLLDQIRLTEQQRHTERANTIDFMKKLYAKIFKCLPITQQKP